MSNTLAAGRCDSNCCTRRSPFISRELYVDKEEIDGRRMLVGEA